MATTPYFVISPNALLSVMGLLHGPDKTTPEPREDWHKAKVDVVIPALNEESNIALCLASIARQTFRPRNIILIDDGSRDHTIEYAKTFCEINRLDLIAIHRKEPVGKTPTIKRQSREFDSDVEFILDADTVLESQNYIERVLEELYKGVGIASACGTILPLRSKDRKIIAETRELKSFLSAIPGAPISPPNGFFHSFERGVTNLYRDVLYMFLQRFVYHGQMVFFGTITNPVGCAVAYRRKYVQDLFDEYEPRFGDDLTNSEDIFIGFAMLNKGLRNIQLTDVYARSLEPEVPHLPHQLYLWSSSFLQCCYYFDNLLKSPFKVLKRHNHKKETQKHNGNGHPAVRRIGEAYRQPFGEEFTMKYGRPVGWVLLMSAIEKVFFPIILIIMIVLGLWIPLAITVAAESILSITILSVVAKGRRLEYLLKGILVTPIRYLSLLFDFLTILRFSSDIWFFKNRRWRK